MDLIYSSTVLHLGRCVLISLFALICSQSQGQNYLFNQKVIPGVGEDDFGDRCVMSGEWAVSSASRGRAVYLYRKMPDNSWKEWKVFRGSGSGYGTSYDLLDDVLIIGDSGYDNIEMSQFNYGRIEIYQRDLGGQDQWGLVQIIEPETIENNLGFGIGISLSTSFLAIGQVGNFNSQLSRGTVSIYQRANDRWSLLTTLSADDSTLNQGFGREIDITDDYLVIRANESNNTGSYYVYERDPSDAKEWDFKKKIFPSFPINGGAWKTEAIIKNDTLLLPEPRASTPNGQFSGILRFYQKDQGGLSNWGVIDSIISPSGRFGENFGAAISWKGDHLAVGADEEDAVQDTLGAGYIFEKVSGAWTIVNRITAPDRSDLYIDFGTSIAINTMGDVMVGADDDPFPDLERGSCYFYSTSPAMRSCMTQLTTLGAYNVSDDSDYVIDIWQDWAIISSKFENDIDLFRFTNGAWTFVKEINPNQGDKRMMDFGRSVSLDGGFLVVGAPDGNSSLGQVFVFHKDRGGANNWGQIDIINKPSHNGGNDFGQSLKLNGDELAVSAQRTDTAFVYQLLNAGTPASQLIHEVKPANPVSSIEVFVVSYEQDVLTMSRRGLVTEGEIFTFKINSTSPQDWNETTRIAPPPGVTPNRFRPTDPKVSGDLLAFCALDDQVQGTSTNQRISKVFIYERDALGGWMLSQEIKSPQDEFQSKFGQTLAWDGTDLYIGAPFADGSFASSGAIHIYKPDASGLYQLYDTFFDCDAKRSDQFGSDIEIDDGHLLIAPRVDLSVQSVEIQKIKSDCIAIQDISSQDVTGSQQSTFRAGMRLNSDARLFHVAPVRFTAGTEVVFQPAFEIGFCGQLQVDIADCD